MTNLKYISIALSCLALILNSCDKDNSESPGKTKGNFVLAVTPVAAEGVADYLLNAPSLESGTISTEGNGLEQDGTYRYYVTHKNKFFSMLYGQGNPGAVTAYNLMNGSLNKLTNFQTETVQAFTPVNNDILMIKMARDLKTEMSRWYRVDADQMLIVGQGEINTKTVTGNGEWAQFSWIRQVGDKVFAPFFCIKDSDWGTDYPNEAWIAVYSYPDMTLEKVIKDDRTSFIGRYFVDGLAIDETGDVYAFSPSLAFTNKQLSSTKPSAVTRIKKGTTEFDDYYFNVETAAEGHSITNWQYIGNGKALGFFIAKADKSQWGAGTRLAVVDLYSQKVTWITGLPALGDITSISDNNYTPKDGKNAYVGITVSNGTSSVYHINVETATATQGLKVEGGVITAISRLD
ncbi:DUF4374 domain-containing protein [Sphingobacterium alkalisoli]|uniref:DUF4374 domain-containing protein n=1 Tax=Sphingobacterium alkalisoli TaxID=1874115 RepID=A0A4V6WF44_9SPHI|nr:DUF4374 domain-containing protein [Sphingobacterium alkalisoli]TJY64459.1 DUF4374 domain-containing protein [Sphingobacterium alkalisoli]GGH21611.1 hypothetical protein GCM10011418_27590 [Sphingobacterium alkalisoli]